MRSMLDESWHPEAPNRPGLIRRFLDRRHGIDDAEEGSKELLSETM